MGAIASQITSLTIVYSVVYWGTDQRIHQSSASLAFVRGIHRGPVNSPHKGPVTRKMFPFDDIIMEVMKNLWVNNKSLLRSMFLSHYCFSQWLCGCSVKFESEYIIFSCDQAALWMVQSVRPSVCLSVRPSVCHTFLTMFPSSYHHEIFRSYYKWQKWRPCRRSRSEVKGQGHRGHNPT